jgi:hypothetical protein
MSKSLARVIAALQAAGLDARPVEMPADTRTAEAGRRGGRLRLGPDRQVDPVPGRSGRLFLFLTAGGNRVDPGRASILAAEPLGRADGQTVRERTGFAIGGVAPLGHLAPLPTWIDPRLMEFAVVWAAAGTPRHIFPCAPGAPRPRCRRHPGPVHRVTGLARSAHGPCGRHVNNLYIHSCATRSPAPHCDM